MPGSTPIPTDPGQAEFVENQVNMVEDDGIGFDVEDAESQYGNHYGLMSMGERVDLLKRAEDSLRPGRRYHCACFHTD